MRKMLLAPEQVQQYVGKLCLVERPAVRSAGIVQGTFFNDTWEKNYITVRESDGHVRHISFGPNCRWVVFITPWSPDVADIEEAPHIFWTQQRNMPEFDSLR